MKKQEINFKEAIKNSVFNRGDFYVKLCFTILFVVIFLISFFSFNGFCYFYSTIYANSYQDYNFQIHTIDVGQGDSFLIKFPNQQCMLIDTGEEKYSSKVCEYIQQFFLAENIKQIDYFVLTHPDSDHIGGAKTILKTFKVGNLLRPPIYSFAESQSSFANLNFDVDESLIYDEVIMFAYEKGIDIDYFYKGMSFSFGGCKAEFLSPHLQNYSASNDYSAVIMFTEQSKKFLFMGDAEEKIEQTLINEYGTKLKADVLKVGHHGSITSTSQDFIDYVMPKYAIISSGNNSQYFPNNKVVSRLIKAGAEIICTNENGSFVMAIENDNVIYSVAKRPPNYLALIFSLILLIVLIVWENPFKHFKDPYFTKKAF